MNTIGIDKVRISVSKYTEKTNKSGERQPVNGTFQARKAGVWVNACELFTAYGAVFAPFNGTFSMIVLRAGLDKFFTACGLECKREVFEAAEKARATLRLKADKKAKKEEETVDAGRDAFITKAKAKAGDAFDRLSEKVEARRLYKKAAERAKAGESAEAVTTEGTTAEAAESAEAADKAA